MEEEEFLTPNEKAEQFIALVAAEKPHTPWDARDLSEALYILQEGGNVDISEQDALLIWQVCEFIQWNKIPDELIL